jgi:hypothetical protein
MASVVRWLVVAVVSWATAADADQRIADALKEVVAAEGLSYRELPLDGVLGQRQAESLFRAVQKAALAESFLIGDRTSYRFSPWLYLLRGARLHMGCSGNESHQSEPGLRASIVDGIRTDSFPFASALDELTCAYAELYAQNPRVFQDALTSPAFRRALGGDPTLQAAVRTGEPVAFTARMRLSDCPYGAGRAGHVDAFGAKLFSAVPRQGSLVSPIASLFSVMPGVRPQQVQPRGAKRIAEGGDEYVLAAEPIPRQWGGYLVTYQGTCKTMLVDAREHLITPGGLRAIGLGVGHLVTPNRQQALLRGAFIGHVYVTRVDWRTAVGSRLTNNPWARNAVSYVGDPGRRTVTSANGQRLSN